MHRSRQAHIITLAAPAKLECYCLPILAGLHSLTTCTSGTALHGGFETPIEPPQGGGKAPPKTGFALGLDPAEARFAGPKPRAKPGRKPGCRPVRRLKADHLSSNGSQKKKLLCIPTSSSFRGSFQRFQPGFFRVQTLNLPQPHDKAADRFGRKVPSTPAPDHVRYILPS